MNGKKLKIYFCASVIGGQELVYLAKNIVDELKSMGHFVLTEHVAKKGTLEIEKKRLGKDIAKIVFNRDLSWLKNDADMIVAEVSTPSLGVGYELSYFLEVVKKPVLCLYHRDHKKKVSFFILGNSNKNLKVIEYKNTKEIKTILETYFNNLLISIK